MSLFKNLSADGIENTDRVGGFTPLPADIYEMVITMAYAGKTDSGALSISLTGFLPKLGKEYKETFYVTGKDGNHFYVNKNTGKKVQLQGFATINDLCMLTVEKPLSQVETETKLVNIYSSVEKKEMPTEVEVLTELLNTKVKACMALVLENKQAKDASGTYVATAETRESNTIDKFLHIDLGVTLLEAENASSAVYGEAWLKQNKDQIRDRRSIKAAESTTKPTGTSNTQTPAPKKSLFSK